MLMKKIITLWFAGISIFGMTLLDGCHRRKDNPCPPSRRTSAAFRMYSTLDYYENGISKTRIVEEDTFMIPSYVTFEALDSSAEVQSYEWVVGRDARVRTGRKFTLFFSDEDIASDSPLTVKLTVKKKADQKCFPDDDGTDTVAKQVAFLTKDNWPFIGTYYGSDNTAPNDKYTIEIYWDPFYLLHRIKGFPGGCYTPEDTRCDGTSFILLIREFTPTGNLLPCTFWYIDYNLGTLSADRKTLSIDYTYHVGGYTGPAVHKVFTGKKQ